MIHDLESDKDKTLNPGIELRSPALHVDSLPAEPQGKPKNTGVSSLSLLQGIFLTTDRSSFWTEQRSSALQAGSLPTELSGKPMVLIPLTIKGKQGTEIVLTGKINHPYLFPIFLYVRLINHKLRSTGKCEALSSESPNWTTHPRF